MVWNPNFGWLQWQFTLMSRDNFLTISSMKSNVVFIFSTYWLYIWLARTRFHSFASTLLRVYIICVIYKLINILVFTFFWNVLEPEFQLSALKGMGPLVVGQHLREGWWIRTPVVLGHPPIVPLIFFNITYYNYLIITITKICSFNFYETKYIVLLPGN